MEQMARNGNTDLTEERAVEKFLHCMLKKYARIVMSIETLLHFKQLTIGDVNRRLKAVQDREKGPHAEMGAADGKLLYTLEQRRAFEKKKEKGPRGWGQAGANGGAASERKTTRDDTCNSCGRSSPGRSGHWAKDCLLPPRCGRQAHVAQVGEEDVALFLVHGCVKP
jgi:hypothetical protein